MKIIISNSVDAPIYEQIIVQVKDSIIACELEAGYMLPSIRQLAKDLSISVITTKRAYDELEKEGYIETVAGKGTYVSAQNNEFIKEKRLKMLEDGVRNCIQDAKSLRLTDDEFIELVNIILKE